MSLCLQFNESGEQMHLATNRGWSDVQRWALALHVESYPALIQFLDYGITEKLVQVGTELAVALTKSPPRDESILTTLRGMHESLVANKSAEVVLITNGAQPITPPKILRVVTG